MDRAQIAALAFVVACGGKDDCTKLRDKVRPAVEAMFQRAGKPPPDIEPDLEAMCGPPVTDEHRAFRACIDKASTEDEAIVCLRPMIGGYSSPTPPATPPPKQPADAGSPDAAPSASVDPTKLPLIGVVDHDRGDETQLYASDADGDDLVVAVWPPSEPMVAVAQGKLVTGQLVAPSRLAAAKSIAAAAGIAPVTIVPHGHSTEVTLQFVKASQRDVMHLLADILRVNIVVWPGSYPDLDFCLRRIGANDVLAAVAALDKLRVTRAGNVTFLVPDGTKLPKLAAGSQLVDLFVWGGTPQQALAALGQVAPVTATSCDATPIDLRLRNVTVAEAIRALEIASGQTFAPGAHCPIDHLGTPAAGSTLAVIAKAGPKAAAVLASGSTAGIVTKARGVDIGQGYITIADTTYQPARGAPPPPVELRPDYGTWLATLGRAQAIVREGTRWFARIELTSGSIITIASGRNLELPTELEAFPPEIGPTGVDLINPDHHNKTHVPLASK